MRIAVTGAAGFLGRYIVNHLCSAGQVCRCWNRPGSDRSGFEAVEGRVEWVAGELGDLRNKDGVCRSKQGGNVAP